MLVCGRKFLAVVAGEREGERERGRESQPQTQTQI
jgi:hypothetical protein